MAESERKSRKTWARNVALVVALLGIAGSITVAVITEQMRRDAQTVLLQRDAYAQYADAMREVDVALRVYAFAIGTQVDVTQAYQQDPSKETAWQTASQELRDADDEIESRWDEVVRMSDRLLLVASGDVIAGRRAVSGAAFDRLTALEDLRRGLVTPDVSQWTPDDALRAFAVDKLEDEDLLQRFDAALGRFLSSAQVDVNSDAAG